MSDAEFPQHSGSGTGDPDADARSPRGATEVDVIGSGLAELLADAGTWVEPPAGLGDRVAAAVRSEADLGMQEPHEAILSSLGVRRRAWLRPALAGAAAAFAFLFGGVVVLSALSGAEETETFSVELVSTGLILDVGGDVDITSLESGLRIDLSAPGLPRCGDGAFYEGWVRTIDGNLYPVGTFHDGGDVTLWAGVELDRIELFTITLETAAGADDPAQASSGEVVLRAAVTP